MECNICISCILNGWGMLYIVIDLVVGIGNFSYNEIECKLKMLFKIDLNS